MSQSTAAKSVKSKKKRKKSAASSPPNIDLIKSKKAKSVPDRDIDTDIEYQSADEFTDDNTSIMESQQPPITAFTTSRSNVGSKFLLTESDREDIAQRVRSKMPDDRESIAQRVREVMKDDLLEMISQIIQPLKNELSETKTLLAAEIAKSEQLKTEMKEIKLTIDEQEQYSRRSCLRLNGIIGDEGNPAENVEQKLLSLADNHHIIIKPEDIDVAHRIGRPRPGYTRSVIVKFTNSKARQRVLSARKSLGNVYINEDLTIFRQSLHYHARSLVRAKNSSTRGLLEGRFFVHPLPLLVRKYKFVRWKTLRTFKTEYYPTPHPEPSTDVKSVNRQFTISHVPQVIIDY